MRMSRLAFVSLSSASASTDAPARKQRYGAASGSTQGEMKERRPAPNAAGKETSAMGRQMALRRPGVKSCADRPAPDNDQKRLIGSAARAACSLPRPPASRSDSVRKPQNLRTNQ